MASIISRSKTLSISLLRHLPNLSFLSPPPTLLRRPQQILHFQLGQSIRSFHDGRPRGPLWKGKKMIGKEALFVILGLKRFNDNDDKLEKFIKTHVFRLLKMDMVAILSELERQQEVSLAVKVLD